ncbi:MAG: biopolymer transporter ExbD [Akkermansia sp.]|nr:biopolymer transporter ExbD [Akkermansia sp.]
MARRKKIDAPEEEEMTSNISSMIDCCFLLLIYFLVATSLVSEKKLDINIPASTQASTSQKPKVDPGNIYVSSSGVVTWNKDLTVGEAYDSSLQPGTPAYLQQRRMDSLVESLKLLKEQAEAVEASPVVMLHGSGKAPHQRIVDVMAALAEADIHSVGLSTAAED